MKVYAAVASENCVGETEGHFDTHSNEHRTTKHLSEPDLINSKILARFYL